MIRLLAKLEIPRDPIGLALVAWRSAMIIETAITIVFSCLTAIAIVTSKCVGMPRIAGYPTQPLDIWALAFMSLLAVVLLTSRAKKAKVIEMLKDYQEPVSRLGPIRITFGEKVLYFTLIGFVVMLGALTASVVSRYDAIVHYCGSAMALH